MSQHYIHHPVPHGMTRSGVSVDTVVRAPPQRISKFNEYDLPDFKTKKHPTRIDDSANAQALAQSVYANYSGLDHSHPSYYHEARKRNWARPAVHEHGWKAHDPFYIVKDPNNVNHMLVHHLNGSTGRLIATKKVPLYGRFRKEIATTNSFGCKDMRGWPKGVREKLLGKNMGDVIDRFSHGTTGIPTDLINQVIDVQATNELHARGDPRRQMYF